MAENTNLYTQAERALRTGRCVEAFDIYKRLAEDGDIGAQAFVGWMYYEGLGVEKNDQCALDWFEQAARRGSPEGAYYYGGLLRLKGQYVDAFKWYQRGAEAEYSPALLSLGLAYLNGEGVEKNLAEAVCLIEKSAALGNYFARRAHALLMLSGKLGPRKMLKGLYLLPAILAAALFNYGKRGYSTSHIG